MVIDVGDGGRTEGVGDVSMASASTPPTEADVRYVEGRSGPPGARRGRGSTAEVEGPLIFSERSGDLGSSAWGGVLAGEDKAFIWEKTRSSSSSSTSGCSSVENIVDSCSVVTGDPRKHTFDGGDVLAIWVQLRRPEPGRSFIRFQSKHVYRDMLEPV